ncbi:hypothetical protein MLGJGCBP_02191 [Rhodococcus sp. T7]|nr:hypothetical protein MLGJGCBP_02191 [Rhodococcus sp. T7]
MRKRYPCTREGCPGTLTAQMHAHGRVHCSPLCELVSSELDKIEGWSKSATDEGVSRELTNAWAQLVTTSDALSEYREAYKSVVRATNDTVRRERRMPQQIH